MSGELTIVLILVISIQLVTGVLLSMTPWLMRRRECFAVTVPESAQRDPQIHRLKVRFTAIMAALTVALIAGSAALAIARHADAALICMFASTLVLCVVSFALMLHYRRKVQALKRERGWAGGEQRSVAVIAEADLPRPLSLAGTW